LFVNVSHTVEPAGQMTAGSNATITEEMYRASLLSAVEDKIRRRLREVFDQAQVTVTILVYVIISIHGEEFSIYHKYMSGSFK